MSSYDSMSPAGGSSPILDHYESQYYCQGPHEQDTHLITSDGVYWSGHELDHGILEKHQTHAGDMYPGQYMARNYSYDVLHADYDGYVEHGGPIGALSIHAQGQHDPQGPLADQHQVDFMMHGGHSCYDRNATGQTVPFVRVVKRRSTANKKERRRTQSINTAFSDLRECIPNVPADTKLSKIKTLRLATSYISYLMGVLDGENEQVGGFRAELTSNQGRRGSRQQKVNNNAAALQHSATAVAPTTPTHVDQHQLRDNIRHTSPGHDSRRTKGRTGWPQHVWALELKQEQNI